MNKVFIISQREEAHIDAIAAGVELARTLDKQAEIFAYSFEYFGDAEYYNPKFVAVAQKHVMKQRTGKIQQILDSIDEPDIPIHSVWSKDLFEHACHHSKRHGFDLIVKAVHHAEHYLPVDWNLIRHTRVPLMLLTDNPVHKSNTVMMALDLDSKKTLKQQLNHAVIRQAVALAEATNCELHLAFVIRLPQVIHDMEIVDTHGMIRQAREKYQALFDELNIGPKCIHITVGEPDLCIYQLACKHKVRYLVLGAVQRQGIYAFVVGNMAESILNRIRSNVLIVPAREGLLQPLE
ncbi:universal stress protein [uncultured Shewanella sp.]|uniref:universal stress protein n=1 Tax=uncultured Shewanella sp. TaxID=173975 RepID=UPI002639E3ED|nr:universal stress protein [uncultured Shewanella sp.]